MARIFPVRTTKFINGSLTSLTPAISFIPRRGLSSAPPLLNVAEDQPTQSKGTKPPRWSYTPPRAKAPFSLRMNSRRPEFHVNSDPARLDQFYIGMLGENGHKILPEELKWLAVTHKSFDQGRRGFNDRLAFLGKRIVQLQASLGLAQDAPKIPLNNVPEDELGRKPFIHPALEGLSNLTERKKRQYLDRMKLADLAQQYGLQKVLRWSPRKPDNLQSSGMHVVLAHTMYAIIGAIALEKGGLVANEIAQKRILVPLGMKIA